MTVSQEELPYELEYAAEAINMWYYAALIIALLTGTSLTKVDLKGNGCAPRFKQDSNE